MAAVVRVLSQPTGPLAFLRRNMKLYYCKKHTQIKLLEDAQVPPAHRELKKGEILHFAHTDGMYSYCRDERGNIVHPAAWTNVGVIPEGEK